MSVIWNGVVRAFLLVTGGTLGLLAGNGTSVAAEFHCGFAKADITPNDPVRLSGYGNRAKPSEGVETKLFVRAMALKADDGPLHVLLAVDTIAFSAEMTDSIFELVREPYKLSRSRFVTCSSHSHATPHLSTGLKNIFATPMSEEERRNADVYTELVRSQCVAAVAAAVADLKPAVLSTTEGKATFARNRRALKDGVWSGFGVNPDGPTDHSLPVIFVKEPVTGKLRGLLFNYACHGTTFGGDYNRVNAEWSGYASANLEQRFPGVVALSTIGCGADQNPDRDPKRALELAQAAGSEIDEEVAGLATKAAKSITAAPVASFGFAGLPIDRPTVDELKQRLNSNRPQERHHAEVMLEIHERMGRLPESYPMPVQVWRFGDEFAMVFLGGEVCVDYSHRVKRELAPKLTAGDAAGPKVWVSGYSNDVFGYVASERMRPEGGYEVDYSMIYFLQPGRWSTGTENVILQRVHELFDRKGGDEPLSLDDALKTFTVPEGYEVQVVAAEPLIGDPVNFAVDAEGRLWVVEMGDYPRGGDRDRPNEKGDAKLPEGRSRWNAGGKPWDGPPGGCIKVLVDEDRDGRYEKATVFLDGLTFPTSVFPWRDGVIVTAAPDILFVRDSDGDGRADHREVLYTGFVESNPQHRINGFEYGLDGWLYLASGAPSETITCVKTGETVNVSGRDIRIHPDSGRLETVSGRSQFGRCRDDFGNAFGNTNSEPLFTFAIDDGDLRRNPFVPSPSPRVFLTTPAGAPPVFPTSRTVDRFNDMSRANRFTSACGPTIFRDSSLGPDIDNAAFLCEPVHNLVHRVMLEPNGVTFRGHRHPTEQKSEFLSSTDPWFRPVRLATGPDRTLWVCDMYRHVIEHPQWIPEAWQARLYLYAGHDIGRIYRLARKGQPIEPIPDLTTKTSAELTALIAHENGWYRDTAQRLLIERGLLSDPVIDRLQLLAIQGLRLLAVQGPSAKSRVQALWTLVAVDPASRDDNELRASMFQQDDPRIVEQAVQVFGLDNESAVLAKHPDLRVRYAVALAAGNAKSMDLQREVLLSIARQDAADPWMRAAVLSSSTEVAADLLTAVLREMPPSAGRTALVNGLIPTSLGRDRQTGLARILAAAGGTAESGGEPWRLELLVACLDAAGAGASAVDGLSRSSDETSQTALATARTIFAAARKIADDPAAAEGIRSHAIRLLGRDSAHRAEDVTLLQGLTGPQIAPALQTAALQSLAAVEEVDFLLERLPSLAPARQATVLTLLIAKPERTLPLLKKVAEGDINASLIDAATRAALLASRHAEIQKQAKQLFATTTGGRDEVIAGANAALTLAGDRGRGRAVFEKRCATCHRHDNIGTEIGPQLGALQNKTREFLLTAILDPNRSVEAKYRSASVVTGDGLQHPGMIVEETATSIALARPDGKKDVLLRRDVEELVVSPLSFMPEGLEKDLTVQDLADVMTFLADG